MAIDAARLDPIFKAYDIRGTVPDQLDAEIVEAVGAAFARFALDDGGHVRARSSSVGTCAPPASTSRRPSPGA